MTIALITDTQKSQFSEAFISGLTTLNGTLCFNIKADVAYRLVNEVTQVILPTWFDIELVGGILDTNSEVPTMWNLYYNTLETATAWFGSTIYHADGGIPVDYEPVELQEFYFNILSGADIVTMLPTPIFWENRRNTEEDNSDILTTLILSMDGEDGYPGF